MEWAEEGSIANRFSQFVSSNDIGYKFKQAVADIKSRGSTTERRGRGLYGVSSRALPARGMYSFTTCPLLSVKAKDCLEEQLYTPMSRSRLDLLPGNEGERKFVRSLDRMTRRTSVH
ncbi:hypothetical protein ACHAW5_006764 [Stephanodiscus triporus]|uniref:Uncharacterized protein n=1 Tax=Stephanodiscus triporus TaxID=2934178 RepID=A0ABD3NSC5_9STRA